jgi:hypothetical protein
MAGVVGLEARPCVEAASAQEALGEGAAISEAVPPLEKDFGLQPTAVVVKLDLRSQTNSAGQTEAERETGL